MEKLIALSAGGTGGHVFPAAALAAELTARGHRIVLFTDARGAKYRDAFGAADLHILPAGSFGPRGLLQLSLGTVQAAALLRRLKPAAVVGFGGYPSVPAVAAAQLLGIPTVLHEQNAVLGRANKLLARRATRIALSLALPPLPGGGLGGGVSPRQSQAASASQSSHPPTQPSPRVGEGFHDKCILTGNPVRAEIAALATQPYPAPQSGGPLHLFIMGGSLGARVFSDVVPAALSQLPAADRARLAVTQQCRAEDLDTVRALYETAGIQARLAPFFNDIPTLLAATHLVISRAGASTVAELTAAGRPAIFAPYPHHADQQQRRNAEAVVAAGGGWMMVEDVFTPENLRAQIEIFLQDPAVLIHTAAASSRCGRPEAAKRLAELIAEDC